MNTRFKEGTIMFNSEILIRDCGDVTLAFNPDTSDMFEFNDTGAEIFEMVQAGLQYEDMINKICSVYDVTADEIYEDVDEILGRMEDVGIINVK